jgi:formate dehydrogenase assembly factor FdhD
MNFDSNVLKVIQKDIRTGFKAVCAASAIISTGADLKLLTSGQNCFVSALTIFRSLGMNPSERQVALSHNEKIFIDGLMESPQDLKRLLHFFLTYAFIVQNSQKTHDFYVKNLSDASIIKMLRYGAMEVQKTMLWILSNIFIDLPVLESNR